MLVGQRLYCPGLTINSEVLVALLSESDRKLILGNSWRPLIIVAPTKRENMAKIAAACLAAALAVVGLIYLVMRG